MTNIENHRKNYKIVLKGYDDSTYILIELTNEEFRLLSLVESYSIINSDNVYQPTLHVYRED